MTIQSAKNDNSDWNPDLNYYYIDNVNYESLRNRILENILNRINDILNIYNVSKKHGYDFDMCAIRSGIELTQVYEEIISFCRTSGCSELKVINYLIFFRVK